MSKKMPNDSTLQSTKQMLDELDALMEKMLSLPVNDPDNAPPFPAEEIVKPPKLAPTLAATLTLLEPPALERTPPSPTYEILEQESGPASLPFNPPHLEMPASRPAEPTVRSYTTLPPPTPEPLTNEVLPPSVMAKLTPLLAEIPEPTPTAATPMGYGTLVWINQAFDSSTLALGGAGHWLRSQSGRTILGLAGIALMLAAVGWFAKDWLGWHW